MKTVLTFLFFSAVTLFAPVSNAELSYPLEPIGFVRGDGDSEACPKNPSPMPYPNQFVRSLGWGQCPGGINGAGRRYEKFCVYSNAEDTRCSDNDLYVFYSFNSASPCKPNSTYSNGTCVADPGYTAQPDGSGGWNIVPQATCNTSQYYQASSNTCTYFPCGGDTPYMIASTGGSYTCNPLPEESGCYEGDKQWIETGGSAGSPLSPTNANGCGYRPYTCQDAIAEFGGTCEQDPATGCITVSGSTSCGGWFVGTGVGTFTPDDVVPPFTGSGDGSGNPGGGGDNNGDGDGSGNGDGNGNNGDGDASCGGFGQPSCPDDDGDGDGEGECDPAIENCEGEYDCDPETESCEGEVHDWQNPGGEGGFFPDLTDELQEAKDGLSSAFEAIRGEVEGKFSVDISGAGSLPCESADLGPFGTFSLCISDYAEQLSTIGNIFVAAFSLLAIFIILG